MRKGWFVFLTQAEIERMTETSEVVTYMSIKSYSANGKREVPLSLSEISKRSKLTKAWVSKIIPRLVSVGLIKIVGVSTTRGGSVNVYKVCTELTVDSHQSVHPVNETVHSVFESVNKLALESPQYKNELSGEQIPDIVVKESSHYSESQRNQIFSLLSKQSDIERGVSK